MFPAVDVWIIQYNDVRDSKSYLGPITGPYRDEKQARDVVAGYYVPPKGPRYRYDVLKYRGELLPDGRIILMSHVFKGFDSPDGEMPMSSLY